MTQIIYIIDYKASSDPEFRFRSERMAAIINEFSIKDERVYEAQFFPFARDLPWEKDKKDRTFLKNGPCLVFLHRGNELLREDSEHCRLLIEYCKKKIPVIVFTGDTPGPCEVNSSRLKNRLNKILNSLVTVKEKTVLEIEKSIHDIINEKSLQDEILKHYYRYINPQLFLLRLTLEGFLLFNGGSELGLSRDVPDITDSQTRSSASNWAWFSPLLAPIKKYQESKNDFTSFCRLFTPMFDLKLSELYCLSLAEKSNFPDENLQESLGIVFGEKEIEKLATINSVTGKMYESLKEIYNAHQSIGKMLARNAGRYSVPVLINPTSPPLTPGEKKYLESYWIFDGQYKAAFLNLWSEEVEVLLSSQAKSQLNNSIRQFVREIYMNDKMIKEEMAIENIEDFKLRIEGVYKELSRIIRYFEQEFGENM